MPEIKTRVTIRSEGHVRFKLLTLGPFTMVSAWREMQKETHTSCVKFHVFVKCGLDIGLGTEACIFLLIWSIWATETGHVSFGKAGTVLLCVSSGPILEVVWIRAMGTEVRKQNLSKARVEGMAGLICRP